MSTKPVSKLDTRFGNPLVRDPFAQDQPVERFGHHLGAGDRRPELRVGLQFGVELLRFRRGAEAVPATGGIRRYVRPCNVRSCGSFGTRSTL